MTDERSLQALEASLSRRYRVVQTVVELPGHSLSILHPASAEDLIDEQDFERDERLPYWAELWPSARVLAEVMLGMSGAGRTLLELGCGSGLVAVCAALAGFDVVASDYYEDAPKFARVNGWRNRAPLIRGLVLDWRDVPDDLPRFDAVIASDVLYERPYGELVAAVMGATLAAGGTAWLADPGRVGREPFLASLEGHGLTLRAERMHRFAEGKIRQRITVYEIARAI